VLSLPPAFVLSQDQTLKFETALLMDKSTRKWSLMRIKLTEIMCLGVATKALSSLNIKRNRLCFGCSSSYPLEPPGHTPPAFLFLSSTMSNSREAFVKLPIHAADENPTGSPFG
jgi:hypothetical protein